MSRPLPAERLLDSVDAHAHEIVELAAELIRIATVNPPGDSYRPCADLIAERMIALGFEVETLEPAGRPEHTAEHPRVNVVGAAGEADGRPCVHFNGHFDVVPPGAGWTVDPFGGVVRDGRLYGRGSADMKAGLAAAIYAAHALHVTDALGAGRVEVSGTVDEESGGFAGVGHLAEIGRIAAHRTDYVIIPEPFGPDAVSLGHRGVYWFKVTARGRTAHGSMPHLGRSAIDDLGVILGMVRDELAPRLAERRTAMPVVPEEARYGSINVNSVVGGQAGTSQQGTDAPSPTEVASELPSGPPGPAIAPSGLPATPAQSPCVADSAEAVFDRRFLPEEGSEAVRREIADLLARATRDDPARRYELTDLMVVEPVLTPTASPLVRAFERAIVRVTGHPARLIASPGTYDHKHVVRIAGIEHCVAYGPGELEQAHQPDESCAVEDILTSARIMALAGAELLGS